MLLQSQDGFIKLLPALPSEWSNGTFKGVCARGGFDLDFTWQNKKITQLKIISKAGALCQIESKLGLKITNNGKAITFKKNTAGAIEFKTVKGGIYVVE
jgi:alpha-L-fucosidase 2